MKTWASRWATIASGCVLMTAGTASTAIAAPSQTASVLVQSGASAKFGTILVNGQGMTLYTLSSEAGGAIRCSGGCLSVWLPLFVPSGSAAPNSVPGAAGVFGTLTRPEGTQVTYNGFPLYTFVKDTAAGDTNGEGIFAASLGGTWHLVPLFTPLAATPVEGLTIHITSTGPTVWGRVTARYALNGKMIQRTCAHAGCRFSVPLGARVSLTQSPTNTATWPFSAWQIRAVTGKASRRIVKQPATSFRMNKVYSVTAIYVVATTGSGYSG